MQDRYAGDIGDFAKYGLLRALSEGHQLGICWYLFPNESHNTDGKHTAYLDNEREWRDLDPGLFDGLQSIVNSNRRKVQEIEKSGLLGEAFFSSVQLNFGGDPIARSIQRANWFKGVLSDLSKCNIVFADPDNGLCEDHEFAMSSRKSWKRLPLSEAHRLSKNRTGVFYHHNTRRPGGHAKEIQYWLSMLGTNVIALRWRRISNRTFFIVNPTKKIKQRTLEFVKKWSPNFELHTPQRLLPSRTPYTAEVISKKNNRKKIGKTCPECGHQFGGAGWTGIDSHWKTHHENIMSYNDAWPFIKLGKRPSEITNLRLRSR